MSDLPLFADTASLSRRGAVLSACGKYRYRLWRRWGDGPKALWVMLNPSTADASSDDPTLRRCTSFSAAHGFGALEVVNLYALRTPSPKALKAVISTCPDFEDFEGPDNIRHLAEAFRQQDGGTIVCAWGEHGVGIAASRARAMMPSTASVVCLGRNASGSPRHPLYLPNDTRFSPLETP